MKRAVLLFLSCAAAALLFAAAAVAAQSPANGLKLAKTSKNVVFNHSAHKKADCKECHHTWDGAGAVKKCSDAGCHDSFDKADKSVKSYYLAMHKKDGKKPTCLSCHTDAAATMDKEAGGRLKGCAKSVCHP